MWQCPYLNHYCFFSQNHICPIVHVYNPNSKSESQSQYLLYLIHFSIWQSENMEILSSNSEHKNMLNRYMHVVFYIEFQLLWQRGTYLYICSYVASWSRICSWGLIWQSLFIVLNNCIPCKLVQDHSTLRTLNYRLYLWFWIFSIRQSCSWQIFCLFWISNQFVCMKMVYLKTLGDINPHFPSKKLMVTELNVHFDTFNLCWDGTPLGIWFNIQRSPISTDIMILVASQAYFCILKRISSNFISTCTL